MHPRQDYARSGRFASAIPDIAADDLEADRSQNLLATDKTVNNGFPFAPLVPVEIGVRVGVYDGVAFQNEFGEPFGVPVG